MSEVLVSPSSTCDVYVYKDYGGRLVLNPVDKARPQPTNSTYPYDYRFMDTVYPKSYADLMERLGDLRLKGYRIPPSSMALLIGRANKVPEEVLTSTRNDGY